MSKQGKPRNRTHQNVRDFWESEAAEWGESPRVTIRDHFFRIHELHTLISLIPRAQRLLDIGCGTGLGTLILSQRAEQTVGVDYSPSMIQWAERLKDDSEYQAQVREEVRLLWGFHHCTSSRVNFVVSDVLDLKLDLDDFDVITGQRLLINLPTFDDQMTALANLRRQASDRARLILVEVTLQGHERTDAYRAHFGLPQLEKYWHNNYVDESRYGEWEKHGWRVEGTFCFDTYQLLSKIIYPAACGLSNCKFISSANESAMEIANIFRTKAAADEIGTASLFRLYTDRVYLYDRNEACLIKSWIEQHETKVPDWSHFGHQKLIVADAS